MSNFSRADNEFCSWMILNQDDLFPSIDVDQALMPSFTGAPAEGSELTDIKRDRKPSKRNTVSSSNVTSSIKNDKERKKEERLMRNREIARNCRKRKREKINAMESELKQLREANRNLELKVAQLQQTKLIIKNDPSMPIEQPQRALPSREARKLEYEKIERLLDRYDKAIKHSEKADTDELRQKVQEKLTLCEEMHSDFGNARKSEIEFHMTQLENLLIPNQLTKISLWSLQQEDEFYDERTKSKTFGGGLWNTLCTEFDLTKDQKRALIDMREPIKKQRENIYECLKILKELKSRVNTNFSSLKSQMRKILNITTPIQQARFLMWMEKNQACMFMLNSLWEQEQTKTVVKNESVTFDTPNITEDTQIKVSTSDMEEALKSSRAIRAMKKLIEKQCSTNYT